MMIDVAGLKLIEWVVEWKESMSNFLIDWIGHSMRIFLLEKVSEKIFLGLHNYKAKIQTRKTPFKLRKLPQEWKWFAILQLQSHGIFLLMKWNSRIQGQMKLIWMWLYADSAEHPLSFNYCF